MEAGFTGSLPSQFGRLTALSNDFHLEGNKLSGSVPSQLGNLLLISSAFYLSENSLTGILPSELGRLVVTSEFSLASNQAGNSSLVTRHS